MSATIKLRCSVYTRKSTEEGLEQEFNSLDAQREACSAFVASQVGLGWKLVPDHYDDGGISGGTMERPALQRLLQDIRDRKIDVVVVYKIDRLTRSLMDFSRIVEIFDDHGVSFVSVTQQFNTTTSMGRLTLNVLLSFAQFEREVTAERIRDKIAASKRKGMWMGGTVPLGYEVRNRKLIVREDTAAEVQRVFGRYLELRSVPALAEEMNTTNAEPAETINEGEGGNTSPLQPDNRRRIGNGKLYYILSNPIYVGKVRHHGQLYAGEHQPIIDQHSFDRAQVLLAEQAPRRKGLAVQKDTHLLNGILFDDAGDRMSPIHARKEGKRYRYYISSRLKGAKRNGNDGWRISAREIETLVLHQLQTMLADRVALATWIGEHASHQHVQAGLAKAEAAIGSVADEANLHDRRAVIRTALRGITLSPDALRFETRPAAIVSWLTRTSNDEPASLKTYPQAGRQGRKAKSRRPKVTDGPASATTSEAIHTVVVPISIRRRGVESRLVIDNATAPARKPDQPLIDAIGRAHAYLDAFTDGTGRDRKQVAAQFGVHPEDVSRILPIAFLSPDLVDAILHGRQPADLSVRDLARGIDLPLSWTEQVDKFAS